MLQAFEQYFYIQNPDLFAEKLVSWQAKQGRHDLPWQERITAYRVLVSELMLQQTQVQTVIPFFERWMARFPNLADLAAADLNEVLSLWQGLGYYARARNLHKAAQYVLAEHAGEIPNELAALKKIPGVGPYTAGAIRAFAFNLPGPIVDGNVKRFFSRLFGIEGDLNKSAANSLLWALSEHLTPETNNRNFAQGLLDMGATLCTKQQPSCERCPFSTHCVAFQTNRQTELPERVARKKKPVKDAHFLCYIRYESEPEILLVQRPAQGIWGALWCLPEMTEKPYSKKKPIRQFSHTFTHFKMNGFIWQAATAEEAQAVRKTQESQESAFVSFKKLEQFGLPAPIRTQILKIFATKSTKTHKN